MSTTITTLRLRASDRFDQSAVDARYQHKMNTTMIATVITTMITTTLKLPRCASLCVGPKSNVLSPHETTRAYTYVQSAIAVRRRLFDRDR